MACYRGHVQRVYFKRLTAPCVACICKGLVTCWPKVVYADVECLEAHASTQVYSEISLHAKTAAKARIAHTVWIVVLVTQPSNMLVNSCRHALSHNSKKWHAVMQQRQSSCISPNEPDTVKQAPLSK